MMGLLTDQPQDRRVRRRSASINGIGNVLGLRTVAEALEDQETLDMLKSLSVDYAEGLSYWKARARM